MGRLEKSDSKSLLVTEICNVSKCAVSCAHCRHKHNAAKSPFIDWYLLLHIEENVGIDTIRKKYRKFALQLHPDKNKHPKAEFAFKLVSEAYACLSDKARRAAFDSERLNSFCSECSRIQQTNFNPPPPPPPEEEEENSHTKPKGFSFSASEKSRSNYKIFERVKYLKARFLEEARVIDNCLKTYATARTAVSPSTFEKASAKKKELPVFNPSDYLSQGGYPHLRERRCSKPENLWWLRTGNDYGQQLGKAKCSSPVFECKSNRSPFQFKSAFLHT